MKTNFFSSLILFAFTCQIIIAQNTKPSSSFLPKPKYEELFKTIPLISDNDPEWVKLLYSETPNYYQIERSYLLYYKDHLFKKNTHVQNFKHLSRIVNQENYLLENGDIKIPSIQDIELRNQRLILSRENSSSLTNSNSWTSIGPLVTYSEGGITRRSSQVNTYCFDQSTTNPNVLFCGTQTSSVYKSINKGMSWESIGDDYFNDREIRYIRIDPTNENIIYISSRNRLSKSIDGGTTWTNMLDMFKIESIAINPNNTDIIYVAGFDGLKKSEDAGLTWTTIYTDKCWDVILKTDDPNTVFVAKSNPIKNITEIYKSTDGGSTFEAKDNGWFSPANGTARSDGGARIGLTDADSSRIYVILLGTEEEYSIDNNYIGIYRSDDAAESWHTPYDGNGDGLPDNEPGGPYSQDHWCFTHISVTGTGYDQGFYNLALNVSDSDPDKFLVGSLNLFKSEDGGITYVRWGGYGCTNCTPGYRHPDIQNITIRGNDVWVCSDGGVDFYDSELNFIESRSLGINGSDYWGFDQGWNHDVLIGGRYHNGNAAYYETYGTGKFLALGGGESPTGYTNKGYNRRVQHSDISGKEIPTDISGDIINVPKYTMFPTQNSNSKSRSELLIDPRYWNIIYLGRDNKLWKSEDAGQNFSLVKDFGLTTNEKVKGIEISRNDPNLIFVTQKTGSTTSKLWKSINGGVDWQDISIPASDDAMFISLNTDNELYLALNKGGSSTSKIFKSNDLGSTWTNLTTSTLNDETISGVHVQEGTNGGVYLRSNTTIWYKNNLLSDWQLFTDGLPLNYRIIKMLPFYKEGKMRLAGNRGIWERNFFEPSLPKAQPMVSTKAVNCEREVVQFEDYSILNHNNANWEWQFPGAATVSSTTIRNPQVTYSTPGDYDVTLTVTDEDGNSDSKTVLEIVTLNENLCSPESDPLFAMSCNSNTDYALNNTVNEANITNFSFTGWVKPNGIQGRYTSIFSLSSGEGPEKYTLNFKDNNTLGIHWNGTHWRRDTDLTVPDGEWSFVAITVSPTVITLYANDQHLVWDINTQPFNLDRIILGRYYNSSSRNFIGAMDEFVFWKRTLTPQEIRLSRHLTRSDVSDPNLVAYYQFNHNSNNKIYDKVRTHDLILQGNANLIPSDVPIGPGNSALLMVDSGGLKDFTEADLTMMFSETGTIPDGEIVASRIEINPGNIPQDTNEIDASYWIINNYGINDAFDPIEEISFSNINNLNLYSPEDIVLYKRSSNSGLNVMWQDVINSSSDIVADNTAVFLNPNISSFSQFYVGSNSILDLSNNTTNDQFILFPNPIKKGSHLNFSKLKDSGKFTLYNTLGQEIIKDQVTDESRLKMPNLSPGMYFYHIETHFNIYSGNLIVKE